MSFLDIALQDAKRIFAWAKTGFIHAWMQFQSDW
jgi:hypothetical protein